MGKYHDLFLKSDTLILADVLENFRKMYLIGTALKKTEVKLELLTDIDVLLMHEKKN